MGTSSTVWEFARVWASTFRRDPAHALFALVIMGLVSLFRPRWLWDKIVLHADGGPEFDRPTFGKYDAVLDDDGDRAVIYDRESDAVVWEWTDGE